MCLAGFGTELRECGAFTVRSLHRMTDTMRKTPSCLKGLAEARAGAAGDAERDAAVLEDRSSGITADLMVT